MNMLLLGGPHDGAEGPHRHAGRPEVWIRSDDAFPNRLFVAASQVHLAAVRYVLTSRGEDSYIYSYGDGTATLHYETEREVSAA